MKKGIKILLTYLMLATFLMSWTIPSGAVVYNYDDLGRLTTATYPNGETLTYTYDAGGNLLSMSFADNSPPSVSSTDPENNASSVTVDKTITVTFNESVVQGVYFSNITLKNDLNGSAVSYTASVSEKNLTIDPTSNLGYGIPYVVTVPAGAVNDINGNALAADYIFSFNTVEDSAAPNVSSTNPEDGATGVSVNASVYVTFSESVVEDVYFSDINIKNTFDSSVVESTYSLNGDLLTIDPFDDLDYSVTYAVYIPAGAVKDTTGNSLVSAYSFTFTTGSTQDTTPPTVTSTDPANGETGVPIDTVIAIDFSEGVQQGDNFNKIRLSIMNP